MPIIVNLDVMLAKRKRSLTELSEYLDINMAGLSLLKTNKARGVRFPTLNNICEFLECQPGELIEYIDKEAYKKLMGIEWEEWVDSTEDDDTKKQKEKKRKK